MTHLPLLVNMPDRLSGPRIVVRPYAPEDAAVVLAGVEQSRADLAHWLPWVDRFRSLDDARALVARSRGQWILREDFVAGIFGAAEGAFVGGVSLHPITWEHRKFEIGYWLCVEARGKGLATEAVRLVTRLAFDSAAARRVEICVDPENVRSCLVPGRVGFVLEGTLRRHLPREDGTLSDMNVYSLVEDDYARLRSGA